MQKVLIFCLFYAKIGRGQIMKKIKENHKMVAMAIVASAVSFTLAVIMQSACAICFYQPKEPLGLYYNFRTGGKEQ